MAGVSVEDSVRLLQLMGTAVGRGAMAVGVEYQGGAVEGLGNPMVTLLILGGCPRLRRISTEAYVENNRRCALVKGILNSLTRRL